MSTAYGLLEDACHAPGGYFIDSKGEKTAIVAMGDFADVSVFSFHPVKHIATGEGGMADDKLIRNYMKNFVYTVHTALPRTRHLLHENHGGWYYEMQELGYQLSNY